MSKRIKYTENDLNEILSQIAKILRKENGINYGKITVNVPQNEKIEKAHMIFSPEAYTKMLLLTLNSKDEIGWHGLVKRKSNNVFYIYDIVVYPQIVTAATIETDEVEYPNWIGDMAEDDSFFDLRFHGHSHVNMECSPSSTDLQNRKDILSQFKEDPEKDMFYLFLIMNKKGQHTAEIYDYTNNIIYENSDIVLDIGSDETNCLNSWLKETAKYVKRKKGRYAFNGYDITY